MNNKGYDDSFLERLKSNNDIIATIGRYVTLNQKGKTHWGNCPFHSEKTPSFAVNGLEQYYHCFGCSESGDVIKFVEKIENVDFMTAVKILADKAGMEVPDFIGDEGLKEKKQKKDKIVAANREAAIYYNKILSMPIGKEALNYLLKRGLNQNSIKKFGLGYSPDGLGMIKHMKTMGYTEEILLEAGLAEKSDKGGIYDVMYGRIMYPIINSFGEVIGFSCRALKDGNFAKYRNTAQTLVFDKGKVVYGINLVKKFKQTEGLSEIIIVEGQMDTIAMHQAGFGNAVACMGTALTKFHAKELKRFTDKIIVCFDGDSAGEKGTLRSLDILLEEQLKVYVISMPEKLDPDEFILKYGVQAYKDLITNAMPLNDYKLKAIAGKFNLDDNIEKAKFIDKALDEIKALKSSYEKEIYLKQLSDKTKIGIHTLEATLKQKILEETKPLDNTNEGIKNVAKDATVQSAEFILASILHKQPFASLVDSHLFTIEEHKKLYDFILKSQNLKKDVKIGDIFTTFSVDDSQTLKIIVNYNFDTNINLEKHFNECVKILEIEHLLNEQKKLIAKIEIESDKEEKNRLMDEFTRITKEINKRK